MVRVAKGKGRKSKIQKNKNEEMISSDSENDHYDNNFDPNNPFGDDEVESFHNERDKILFKNMNEKGKKSYQYSSDEEEVLAFDGEDDDSDEKYDIEDDEEDNDDDMKADEDDLPSAWGRKKSAYYSGNRIENEEDAELEEEEANLLQAKMMKSLDTNDFGLNDFKLNKGIKVMKSSAEIESKKLASTTFGDLDDDENVEKIVKNLSKMSKKEKLDFLQQESPELFELIRDFKAKLSELQEVLLPIFNAIKHGQIPHSTASDFMVNKTKLFLIFCSHLSFYFVLKSQRVSVSNHPIIKNILQFRNLCKQINMIDDKLEKEIEFIKKSLKEGRQLSFVKPGDVKAKKIKKSVRFRDSLAHRNLLKFDDDDDDSEADEKELDKLEQADFENGLNDFEKNEDESSVGKRAINYQIEKNKGLTPKRDKSYRNPRVRNRLKARKALIKRKSIVRNVRSQDKRYSGEATGIRSTVVRAVKIK